MTSKFRIGIIGGAGKMGGWITRLLLKEGYQVVVADKDEARLAALKAATGVQTASTVEVAACSDVLVLSVTIDRFSEMLAEISPLVKVGQIVFDVTSIKAEPVRQMQRALKTNHILGTHPVFGPGAKELHSQNVVLTPTNPVESGLADRAKGFLEARGARVSIMSPQEHDRTMAVVLGLAHFISIVAADTLAGIGNLDRMKSVGGSTYRVLTTLVESVISEDPELYATLQTSLPGLAEMESLFLSNAARWAAYVKAGDKQSFKREMAELKEEFARSETNFGQAYENMYKIMEWL